MYLFLDTSAYVIFKLREASLSLNHYQISSPTNEQLLGFYEKWFHPYLGWNLPKERQGKLGNRKGKSYPQKEVYSIKAFGDSFTQSTGDDMHTWESYLEDLTGFECLNYGVAGYGTDQALLKYKIVKVPTKYTLLCIMDENIARCMNHYRGFYIKGNFYVKPRYKYSQETDSIYFIPNPMQNLEDLKRLQDPQYVKTLKKNDDWYQRMEKFNSPKNVYWPASVFVWDHLDYLKLFFIKKFTPSFENLTSLDKHYIFYRRDSQGMIIMKYILDEFIREAESRNEIPVVVIFPFIKTMKLLDKYEKLAYQPLIDYLEEIDLYFIDFSNIFIEQKDYLDMYLSPDTHFSDQGNQVVAHFLADFIQSLEFKN